MKTQTSKPDQKSDITKNTVKNQTSTQKEKNLTEKDINPSKQEKEIIKEHGRKNEQQTGNRNAAKTDSAIQAKK